MDADTLVRLGSLPGVESISILPDGTVVVNFRRPEPPLFPGPVVYPDPFIPQAPSFPGPMYTWG